MTALDDIIRLADAVLDERVSDLTVRIRAQQAAPDLARALKAVAEALDEFHDSDEIRAPLVDDIRAAIERRLVKP